MTTTCNYVIDTSPILEKMKTRTWREVAKQVGMPHSRLYDAVNNGRFIKYFRLIKLCEVLGIDPQGILKLTTDKVAKESKTTIASTLAEMQTKIGFLERRLNATLPSLPGMPPITTYEVEPQLDSSFRD